jgi:tetratricopeptide (TPR) repeat protein
MPDAYAAAASFYNAGRFDLAEAAIRVLIRQDPQRADAFALLAASYSAQGKFEAAERAIATARGLCPDDPTILYFSGIVALDQRNYQLATEFLTDATAKAPSQPAIWAALAQSLCGDAQYAEAINAAKQGLAISATNASCLAVMSTAQLKIGQSGAANRTSSRMLSAHPERASAHHVAGNIALSYGLGAKAELHFREALRIKPTSTSEDGLKAARLQRSTMYWLVTGLLGSTELKMRHKAASAFVLTVAGSVFFSALIARSWWTCLWLIVAGSILVLFGLLPLLLPLAKWLVACEASESKRSH